MHLIIERASRYQQVPLIGNSNFARNAIFSQTVTYSGVQFPTSPPPGASKAGVINNRLVS